MQIASDVNQLSDASQAESRMIDLRVWMVRNGITFVQIGKSLDGITGNAVHQLLKGNRVPSHRHSQLLDFGIPAHLLPPAQDVPRGRPPKQ